MTKKGMKSIIPLIICVIISIYGFFQIQELFKIDSPSTYQGVKGFYAERRNSLDAVIIGGSNVHASWEPPFAWKDYGMAVYSFSIDSLNFRAVPYMIDEVRKTQPQALLVINLSSFKPDDLRDTEIHRESNYMPFSINKLKMINSLSHYGGYHGLSQMEFYFPLIRFHSAWPKLSRWKFTMEIDGLKHGLQIQPFLDRSKDQTKKYYITDSESELPNELNIFMNNLLDYCDRNNLDVLFINSPQAFGKNHLYYTQLNKMQRIVTERGYPCLDLWKSIDDIGINTKTDFYDERHTNIHGAIKYTEFLAKYLKDNYGFADKRGMPGWESWDKSVELYSNITDRYTLPFERQHEPRDYELSAPVINKPKVEGTSITIAWEPGEGTEFYDIYRKSSIVGDEKWSFFKSTGSDEYSITDTDLLPGEKYTYTVVPGIIRNNEKVFGNFNFTGVTGQIPAEDEK